MNCTLGVEWEKYIKLQEEYPELFADSKELNIVTDKEEVIKYENENSKKIGVVYESPFNMLLVDLVRNKDGAIFAYERIVPAIKRDAVVMLPIYQGKIILMKQFRHAIRSYQYCIPRGFAEKDISVVDNVKKELIEELGATTSSISSLGFIVADSGLSAGRAEVFLCQIDEYDKSSCSEGIVEIVELEIAVVKRWISEGKITDGFTLAAVGMMRIE